MNQVEIFYVPIGVETYMPMTPENIEESAVFVGEIALTNRRIKKLFKLLGSSSKGEFEIDNLRAKIVLPENKVTYIDNNGGIHSPELETYKLFDSELQAVKKILERVTVKR
ncbi:hypothetical protein [Exilibacterium tricleocarpae]|uniref:hypothetical protein n=1 Tax=Exilibacterium tricleocarpae TaxID=2591008 RepID=UPI00115D038B|nr:hypothetical protein [Exilibacterium tricleocarpae]